MSGFTLGKWFERGGGKLLLTLLQLGFVSCGADRPTTNQKVEDPAYTQGEAGAAAGADARVADRDANVEPDANFSGDIGSATDAGPSEPSQGECSPSSPLAQKRIVRLTTAQIIESMTALFSPDLGARLAAVYLTSKRTRLPLHAPDEGIAFDEATFSRVNEIADVASRHVQQHFTTLTGCEPDAPNECVETYLYDLAERAYREPLSSDDRASLATLLAELWATDASPSDVARLGVLAISTAPQFLYRKELGGGAAALGSLSDNELAQQMSYFITNGPPDDELRAAVLAGRFAEPQQRRSQAERLLATEEAQKNLTEALLAYFDLPRLQMEAEAVVSRETQASMQGEVVRVINASLRSGTVDELLTSRYTYLDSRLAAFYGIPVDATLETDEVGFARVELPKERSGLLTTAAFLTTDAAGERHSVVARGMLVRGLLLCEDTLNVGDFNETVSAAPTERARAENRLEDPKCQTCHSQIDPYGLALEAFDAVGRVRVSDEDGSDISATATLPDGTLVDGIGALTARLTMDDGFASCLSRHWLEMSLGELGREAVSACTVRDIMKEYSTSSRTMSDLIRAVVASPVFGLRQAGTLP